MRPEMRSEYAEEISSALRYATEKTGLAWPEGTILVVPSYSDLAQLDDIIGLKIFAANVACAADYWPAFPAEDVGHYKLLVAFKEAIEIL